MELSAYANYELGEAFFQITNAMVIRDGIPVSAVGDFELVSPSWRKLADKKNKTPKEIEKIDIDYKTGIQDLADSCIFYMGVKTGNKSYKFTFDDYKNFLLQTITDKSILPKDKTEMDLFDKKIKTQFLKIANHGEKTGDNLIDNQDWAAYIYALDMKSQRDKNNEFQGFILNGKITPLDYAVAYNELRKDEDNLTTLKLRHAYKNLYS